jgi:hypothetical protein
MILSGRCGQVSDILGRMESSANLCASCSEALSDAEVAFGARLCPLCSSTRAETIRSRVPEDGASDVTLLEQEILERVQRELAVDSSATTSRGAALFNPSGTPLSSETSAAGLVLIDGMGLLVPLPSEPALAGPSGR